MRRSCSTVHRRLLPSTNPPRRFPRRSTSLAPELLLPAQFNTGVRNEASLCPDKRLMLAVLEEAVADVQRYVAAAGRESQRLFREAATWFESEDTAWLYSFANSCQPLGSK